MSELVNDRAMRNGAMREALLATASSLVLAFISTVGAARADEGNHPTVWLELGGQMESLARASDAFTAPFMTAISPTPAPYRDNIFDQNQSAKAFGLEGKITIVPEQSSWQFSASVRYGRSHSNRHVHHQTPVPPTYTKSGMTYIGSLMFASPFADIKSPYKESHLVLDFTVGRDVGLGMFGGSSSSVLSAGVRYAQFSQSSTVHITGRPTVVVTKYHFANFLTFNQYMLSGQSDRNFHGIGPSLSWQASAAVLGNDETGELTVDWGINGSLLFGRQKAATNHTTSAYNDHARLNRGRGFTMLYGPYTHHSTRSKGVTVPNVGGFAGLSVKYPNAKLSLGYRADFFFGAVDAGIDTRDAKELGFHGPFAAISVGLGG